MIATLNAKVRGIKGRTKAGVRAAALHVKGRSLLITPKKTGHLQNSAYTIVKDQANGPAAEIGYTAAYAVFVHEIDKHYTSENPHGQWKFLETAMIQERKRVLQIIQALARVR